MAKRPSEGPSKAGVISTAKKADSSRHGWDEHPATRKAAGAYAQEEKARAHLDPGRGATKPSKRAALPKMRKRG